MNQSKKTYPSFEEKLQSFKKRHNLQEVNTSKEAAFAIRVSDFTMRLSRSTGHLLGTKAPKHTNYGRTVRYHAGDLMNWFEQNENETEARVMNSEIQTAVTSIFRAVTIPDDRMRTRKCARIFEIFSTVSAHGVDLLAEQQENLDQHIGEIKSKMQPSRTLNNSTPELEAELKQLKEERQILSDVFDLLTCISHTARQQNRQAKSFERQLQHFNFDCSMEGM